MKMLALALAIELMAADDYRDRERGSLLAANMVRGDPARCGPVVAAAAWTHPVAEVRSRCGRLGGIYRAWVAATYVPKTVGCWPCVDAIEPPEWELSGHYLAQAGDVPSGEVGDGPYWWRYRRGTELYVRSQLAHGEWSTADADDVLARMWKRELEMTRQIFGDRGWLPAMHAWRWTDGYPKPPLAPAPRPVTGSGAG